MANHNFTIWLIAIVLGSLLNMGLFMFLPSIGHVKAPKPPEIIELVFLAWRPAEKVKPAPKKVVTKPIEKKKPKPKPKPKKKIKKTVVKPKPQPKPVLSEKIIPDKAKPKIKPPEAVEAPVEENIPMVPDVPVKDVDEGVLPTPAPIFKLDSLASMLHRQEPVYPLNMKELGKEAVVKLKILIDSKGRVRKITVKKSGGFDFDLAAMNAIRKSTFTPARIKGKAVSVLMVIPVKFRLR